jgi:hypothetical protein
MSTSLTVLSDEQRGSIAVVVGSLSEAVKYSIRELIIAFPSPNISTEERTVQLGIYRDAVFGFEEELVVSVAKWLRFHNPRNTPNYTQPPTPQDVHVAIRNRREKLARQSAEYFFGGMGYDENGRRRWKKTRENLPNCSRALAEKLATELYKPADHNDLIARMTDEAFAELPDAMFGSGNPREPHIEYRAHLAYLRGMDDDTWHLRRAILMHDRHCRLWFADYREPRLTEERLMDRTRELLAEFLVLHPPDPHDYRRKHHIAEFLQKKALYVNDDRELWPNDLRCVPISVLRGEREPSPVAEIVKMTARMIGEAAE